MKPMMEGMMKDSRVKTTVILPAPLESVSIYTKTAANTVELAVDGKKFIEAMDKVIADDDFMGKQLKEGRDFMSEGPAGAGVFLEKMFGKKDPPRVVTKGAGAAKFDFSAEVAEAKRGEEALHKELGIGVEVGRASPIFRERNPEVLLRNVVHFDLLGFGGVKMEGFDDEAFRNHLQECLMQNNFSYDFNTPHGGSSGSMGSNTKSIRVDSKEEGIYELRLHLGGDNAELSIRQDPKKPSFRLILIDPSRELITLFIRDEGGRLRLMGFEGDDGFSANWKSADEAFRKDPGKLWERLLLALKEFPLNTGITPAHPEMMDLCLKWHEGPDKKVADKVKKLRDRMTADDPDEREEASKELREYSAENVQALRAVIELIENESDAEAKGRLLEVAKAGKEQAAAIRYVTRSGIHRDLGYLGSMLGSGGRAKAAQLRLEALTGKKFADRADFEAWYAEHGARMIWDGKTDRYRKGE
jgi:hypothetical protein